MFSYVYYMFAFTDELFHFIILFLFVAFSFLLREVPLTLVIKLVCGAELFYLLLICKAFDFSIKSE